MTDLAAVAPPELLARMERLLDRHDVEDVLLRYASSIDRKDYATLRTVFADDARGQYGDFVVEGADALVAWIESKGAERVWQHHLMSVYHVDFPAPGEAVALTYHTSHQTAAGAPDDCYRLVARYHDTLRKGADGRWLITEKVMELGWADLIHDDTRPNPRPKEA